MKVKSKRPDSPITYSTHPCDSVSYSQMIPVVSQLVPEVCSTTPIVSFTHIPDQPLDRLFRSIPFHQVHHELLPIGLCPSWPSTQM